MDGPGQGEARTLGGVLLRPDNYLSALRSVLDYLHGNGYWNGDEVWVIGSSLRTRWALELAAADSRVKGNSIAACSLWRFGPITIFSSSAFS